METMYLAGEMGPAMTIVDWAARKNEGRSM
jgi:hypothetical protein